ncbi:methyltransferase [Halobacterium wangiae]|uniref:methyltransferase n=1 Tax=Halobacterium wangiae TaxID=2902623 RepID=UPI001E5CBC84|nr:methyltransferase [Halobacterium wangiae]
MTRDASAHEHRLRSHADRGPDEFVFSAAAGVASPDGFRAADLLLLEHVDPAADADVLVPAANYGVVGTVLGALSPSGRTLLAETSARAAGLCERNLAANDVAGDVALEATLPDATADTQFDVVAYAPRDYDPVDAVKQHIADALAALRPGSDLYLAAHPREGGKRYRDALADIAGGVDRIDKRAGVRLFRAERPATLPPTEYATFDEFTDSVAGDEFTFATYPGVFSGGHVDHGTQLLAETVDPDPEDTVLDLCCGYGPLGAVVADRGCETWFTDDSAVATACTRRTLDANGLDGRVETADCAAGLPADTFDLVVSNPPTHAGTSVLHELFARASDVLQSGGEFLAVHHEALDLPLDRAFSRVETVAHGEEHAVVRARN